MILDSRSPNPGGIIMSIPGIQGPAGDVSWVTGTAGRLPATSGQKLTTQFGNTLDDGAGKVAFPYGGTLDLVTIGATTPAPSITATTVKVTGNVALTGTQKPWLNQTGLVSGSLTGGGAMNQLLVNDAIVGDTNYIWNFHALQQVFSPSIGLRGGIWGHCLVQGAGANTQVQAQYVGVYGRSEILANIGGTTGTPIGSFWGGWNFASIRGTGIHALSMYGAELDVYVAAGNDVSYKYGLSVGGVVGDAVRGTVDDILICAGKQDGTATTWHNGIMFGFNQGAALGHAHLSWPFASDSTIFGTCVADGTGLPANIGIDFSNITFTTAALIVPAPIVPSSGGSVNLGSTADYWAGVYTNVLAFEGSSPAITGNPALGTPASGTLAHCTGLPLAGLASAAYSTTPAASTLAEWDSNKNLSASAFIPQETATAASSTPLSMTVASTQVQVITGTTTAQTVLLPTTSIKAGQQYIIINQCTTASVTVESSGGTIIGVLSSDELGIFTALFDTPTANFHWSASMMTHGVALNVFPGALVITSSGTAVVYTLPAASDTLAGLAAAQTFTHKTIIPDITSTATAAGTTTLTATSNPTQLFTGTSTQTVLLPTTGAVAGQQWRILNTSTGTVTVESSAGNAIANGALAAGAGAVFTALVATPTTAANWFAH